MKAEEKLKEMGIVLPACPKPVAAYIPGAVTDSKLVFLSGQTAKKDGEPYLTGKAGKDLSAEEAYQAARGCALMLLAEMKAVLGDLELVDKIVKVNGYVNSAPDFTEQPKVINGASEFFEQVFGERGKHARTAIGVAALPENASVEVEVIIQKK